MGYDGYDDLDRDGQISVNLRALVLATMADDDEPWEKCGSWMRLHYAEANALQKEFIDDVFIALCGWSLATLIHAAENDLSVDKLESRRGPISAERWAASGMGGKSFAQLVAEAPVVEDMFKD